MIKLPSILFSKYKQDREFRAGVSLGFSLLVNILYGIFKGIAGIHFKSRWLVLSACYYMVLGMEKLLLAHRLADRNSTRIKQHKTCRRCGLSMIVLNTAISGMSFVTIKNNLAVVYPQYMIYLAALYTFYNIGLAVYNIIVFHRLENPVYYTAKGLSLTNALVSVFSLQVAMLAEFGDGGRWRKQMNIITSAAVYIITYIIAIGIFYKSHKAIKKPDFPYN